MPDMCAWVAAGANDAIRPARSSIAPPLGAGLRPCARDDRGPHRQTLCQSWAPENPDVVSGSPWRGPDPLGGISCRGWNRPALGPRQAAAVLDGVRACERRRRGDDEATGRPRRSARESCLGRGFRRGASGAPRTQPAGLAADPSSCDSTWPSAAAVAARSAVSIDPARDRKCSVPRIAGWLRRLAAADAPEPGYGAVLLRPSTAS